VILKGPAKRVRRFAEEIIAEREAIDHRVQRTIH